MDVDQDTRHPSLYFSDGDIVLSAQARPTQLNTYFRVHRVYLTHNSQVFRDMFTVASSQPSAEEVYDGVPLVRMAGDDAADLAGLLDVMYNPSHLHRQLTQPLVGDVPVRLAGLVRIAKKYDVKDIGEVVIDCVKECWPESLGEWDEMNEDYKLALMEPAGAFVFALEHGLKSILPATFYKLATTSTATSWDDSSDGARWHLLPERVDMLKFVKTRDDMFERARDKIESIQECLTNDWKCKRSNVCGKDLEGIMEEFTSRVFCRMVRLGPAVDYLRVLEEAKSWVLESDSGQPMCKKCWAEVRKTVAACRQEFWDEVAVVVQDF